MHRAVRGRAATLCAMLLACLLAWPPVVQGQGPGYPYPPTSSAPLPTLAGQPGYPAPEEPTPEPPAAEPSEEPEGEPTGEEPTPEEEPSEAPSEAPTDEPAPTPTDSPSPTPTATATASATPTATPSPTAEATATPTSSPTPEDPAPSEPAGPLIPPPLFLGLVGTLALFTLGLGIGLVRRDRRTR